MVWGFNKNFNTLRYLLPYYIIEKIPPICTIYNVANRNTKYYYLLRY